MPKKESRSHKPGERRYEKKVPRQYPKNSKKNFLYGIQPVLKALQYRKRNLERLYFKKNFDSSKRLKEIEKIATKIKLPISVVSTTHLSAMCQNAVHQGVVLICGFLPFDSLKNLPKISSGKYPIIVALDQIEDPHNLGAIIRTCGFYNVTAVVVPRDHTSALTPIVSKVSAGVLEWFSVISVPNLARFIHEQKSKGFWIVGLEGKAEEKLDDITIDRPLILVLGNEGRGIRQLVKKNCDRLINIPGNPEVSFLNVSNAAAVVLFHLNNSSQSFK